jgi:hypothetical protein
LSKMAYFSTGFDCFAIAKALSESYIRGVTVPKIMIIRPLVGIVVVRFLLAQ